MGKVLNQKESIVGLLDGLNRDLEEFIAGSIESSISIEKWSSLSNGFEPIRCWEIRGCKKKICPAFSNVDHRCWLTVGTLCGGTVQGEFAKKYKTCFECEVFKKISAFPVRRLYENINTIIYHLRDRAVKLHELAIKDPLTDLYNRHFFNEVIEREAARSERSKESLSFIMIDMDYLKHINDTLGHLTGDKILMEAARLIQNTVRKSDVVFRFGGDEFLVLMANADYKRSMNMADRLLGAATKWNKDHANTYGCKLSFSMGCSTHENGRDIHTALKEADERMYENKKKRKKREQSNMP